MFKLYTSKDWMEKNSKTKATVHHNLRLLIQRQTWQILDEGCYQLEDGRGVRLDKGVLKKFCSSTLFVPFCHNDFKFKKVFEKTEIMVFEGDCIDVGRHMVEKVANYFSSKYVIKKTFLVQCK